MTTAADPARDWIAREIRSRVIGPDPTASSVAIMREPGPRWFDEGAPIRQVHGDAAMFAGGLRAILLQSLHPLAMAGVAQHSDYRNDPWGRLQRTAEFLAATTYGPIPMAERAVARVLAVHRHVVGEATDGRAYSANDPHLLRWVHVAEVDSFLCAHRRFGEHALDRAQADAYVRDTAVVARKLGVNEPPCSVAELRTELREYRSELQGTPEAREAAHFLLIEPPLPFAARAPYGLLAAAAVSLLPAWARWPLRLPYLPVSERLLVRPAGSALTQIIRWSLSPR